MASALPKIAGLDHSGVREPPRFMRQRYERPSRATSAARSIGAYDAGSTSTTLPAVLSENRTNLSVRGGSASML